MPRSSTTNTEVTVRIGRNVFATAPRVSVIIPAYNSAEFIEEALDSVLAQKFREHEIIVVNDGSPDTAQFERAINTRLEEIVYIKQPNLGAGEARNTAIRHARGSLLAFLDADDVWQPDYLARQCVYLERHRYDMVYCDAVLFGTNSAYRRTFMETAPSTGEADFEGILTLRCNVITSGTMVRRETVIHAGMFETERVRAHDFHLWLRIAQSGGRIGYQRLPLLKHRVRRDSLSGDSVSRVEREIEAFERVRRTLELSETELAMVDDRIAGLNVDLSVERGKALLNRGAYREAAAEFSAANRQRRSLKLFFVGLLARIAPRTLVKYYRTHRAGEIAMLPR